jgi:broad specificity phosphatase PhoE
MKLFLLRHGETAYNAKHITQDASYDIDITVSSKLELDEALPKIEAELIDNNCRFALCSPALRAKRTMFRLAQSSTTPLVSMSIVDELKEVDFGVFGSTKEDHEDSLGLTMQDCRDLIGEAYKTGCDFSYEQGESIKSVDARCDRVIEVIRLIEENAKDSCDAVLIVGHNRMFRHLMVKLGMWERAKMFEEKLPHAQLVYAGEITSTK